MKKAFVFLSFSLIILFVFAGCTLYRTDISSEPVPEPASQEELDEIINAVFSYVGENNPIDSVDATGSVDDVNVYISTDIMCTDETFAQVIYDTTTVCSELSSVTGITINRTNKSGDLELIFGSGVGDFGHVIDYRANKPTPLVLNSLDDLIAIYPDLKFYIQIRNEE